MRAVIPLLDMLTGVGGRRRGGRGIPGVVITCNYIVASPLAFVSTCSSIMLLFLLLSLCLFPPLTFYSATLLCIIAGRTRTALGRDIKPRRSLKGNTRNKRKKPNEWEGKKKKKTEKHPPDIFITPGEGDSPRNPRCPHRQESNESL